MTRWWRHAWWTGQSVVAVIGEYIEWSMIRFSLNIEDGSSSNGLKVEGVTSQLKKQKKMASSCNMRMEQIAWRGLAMFKVLIQSKLAVPMDVLCGNFEVVVSDLPDHFSKFEADILRQAFQGPNVTLHTLTKVGIAVHPCWTACSKWTFFALTSSKSSSQQQTTKDVKNTHIWDAASLIFHSRCLSIDSFRKTQQRKISSK